MGLFGKKVRGTRPKVLQAAGMRIDLSSPLQAQALAQTRMSQTWQGDAWGYRDMVPELRFALQFNSRAAARVKFFVAEVVPDEDEPIALDSEQSTLSPELRAAAEEELARLPLDAGYRFVGVISENLGTVGEVWLHGYLDTASDEECWEALSVDEVIVGQDGLSIRKFGEANARPIRDGDAEELLRIWLPHPRFGNIADSPMRALMDVLEGIVLGGREMRAASRSRIASNGLLLMPRALNSVKNLREDLDDAEADDRAFASELAAMLVAPITDESSASAIAPPVLFGDAEDLRDVRHLTFDRITSEKLADRVERDLSRMARGLDISPEIISGVGDANHWTAWQIDASTYRYHIDPGVRDIADGLTQAFLRPALLARGFSAKDVRRVQVWRDAGVLTENPNRGADAINAFDRFAIGREALREALGFNATDAPTDDELLEMIAAKANMDTATASALLQVLLGNDATAAPIKVKSERQGQLPAAQDAPATPLPNTAPAGITAAGWSLAEQLLAAASPTSGWTVDEESGRRLMEIDRALRDKLLTAADAALTRALEKAGAKLRSKAQKDPELRHKLSSLSVDLVGLVVTPEGARALGVEPFALFDDTLEAFRNQFNKWTSAAVDQVVAVVLRMLALVPDVGPGQSIAERVRSAMLARVQRAGHELIDQLVKRGEQYLYDPHPDQQPGEAPDAIVPPALIRGALAEIGGALPGSGGVDDSGDPARPGVPVGGLATGATVSDILREQGSEYIGFEWAYGITSERNFLPHVRLDGQRFTGWRVAELATPANDNWLGEYYTPGDHRGCMCDYIPLWAIAERDVALADEPPARDRQRIAALQQQYIGKG